jgi:DNA-binding PadR family transcriptional regulator
LTHLQFIVLKLAAVRGGLAGRDVREQVSAYSGSAALSAFWKTMARLEKAGYLTGSYEFSLGDHGPKMRRYRTTAAGRKACRQSCKFYARHSE